MSFIKSLIVVFVFSLIFWVNSGIFIQILLSFSFIGIVSQLLLNRDSELSIFKNLVNIGLLIYTIAIVIIISFSLDQNGNLDNSFLIGDASTYYYEAKLFSQLDDYNVFNYLSYTRINYYFYQFLLSIIFGLFENDYLSGLFFSALLGVINLILILKICKSLNSTKRVKYLAALFYIISPHAISASTILLKDNLLVFSFLLLIYSSLNFKNKSFFINIIYFFTALFLCTLIRLPFLIPFILASVTIIIFNKQLKFKTIILLGFISIAFASTQVLYNATSIYGDQNIDLASAFEKQQNWLSANKSVYDTGFTKILLGNYTDDPITTKIIKLPITLFVQYLNPINVFDFDYKNPWFFVEINLKIIWLLFLGPLIIYSFLNIKRIKSEYRLIFLIAILGYAMVAFLQGGVVPRYALCFILISSVPIAYVFENAFLNKFNLKYGTFNFVYLTLSVLGLCIYILN